MHRKVAGFLRSASSCTRKSFRVQRKSSDRVLDDHLTPAKANNVRTPIADALSVLMPWSSDPCGNSEKPSFPGLHEFVRQLTGGRTTVRAVRLWLAGRRHAPDWFVAILRDQLLARRAEIDAALEALAAGKWVWSAAVVARQAQP